MPTPKHTAETVTECEAHELSEDDLEEVSGGTAFIGNLTATAQPVVLADAAVE